MVKSVKSRTNKAPAKAKSAKPKTTKPKTTKPKTAKPKVTKPKEKQLKKVIENGDDVVVVKRTKRKASEPDDDELPKEDAVSMGLTPISKASSPSVTSNAGDFSDSGKGASDGKDIQKNTDSPSPPKRAKHSGSNVDIPGADEDDLDEDSDEEDEDEDLDEDEGGGCIVNAVEEEEEDGDGDEDLSGATGQVHLSDFSPRSQKVAQTARLYIRVYLATVDAFPSKSEDSLLNMISDALRSDLGSPILLEHFESLDDVEKSRLATFAGYTYAQLRGELKTKAKDLLRSLYGISIRKEDTSTFIPLILWLVKGNFTKGGTDLDKKTFDSRLPFGADIIKELILQQWFGKGGSEGINARTCERFANIPLPALALAISAIENALNEWKTGTFSRICFSKTNSARRYYHHCKTLTRLSKNYEAWWTLFRKTLYKCCIRTFNYISLSDDESEAGEELDGFDFDDLESGAQVLIQKNTSQSSASHSSTPSREAGLVDTSEPQSDHKADIDATLQSTQSLSVE